MDSIPYHICVFTIRQSKFLDSLFNKGGHSTITEGRRWVEASNQKAKADVAQQPFLVVFAAGEGVEDLLYYAVVNEIRVHPTKYKTEFEFSGMKRFAQPAPHKTDLILINSKRNVSPGQIRPYSICRTPSILLGGKPPRLSPQIKEHTAPALTITNVRSEIYSAIFKATSERMVRGDDQIFSTDALATYGSRVQEGRRRTVSQKLSEIFRQDYNIAVTESEILSCEMVDNLVDLVRKKIRQYEAD